MARSNADQLAHAARHVAHDRVRCGVHTTARFTKLFETALEKCPGKPILCMTCGAFISRTNANALAARALLSEEQQKLVHVWDGGYMRAPGAQPAHTPAAGGDGEQARTLSATTRSQRNTHVALRHEHDAHSKPRA